MNKAFSVLAKTIVTNDSAGSYYVWDTEKPNLGPRLLKKERGDFFHVEFCYRRLSDKETEYPEDIKVIRVEPVDAWWVVNFTDGCRHQFPQLKRGKYMYMLMTDALVRQGHWSEYEFIKKIEEPS